MIRSMAFCSDVQIFLPIPLPSPTSRYVYSVQTLKALNGMDSELDNLHSTHFPPCYFFQTSDSRSNVHSKDRVSSWLFFCFSLKSGHTAQFCYKSLTNRETVRENPFTPAWLQNGALFFMVCKIQSNCQYFSQPKREQENFRNFVYCKMLLYRMARPSGWMLPTFVPYVPASDYLCDWAVNGIA